jgi:hypothetical protein
MARVVFGIVVGFVMIAIIWVYPLVAVARGRSLAQTTLKAWGLSAAYSIAVCIGIPMAVDALGKGASWEVLAKWVPESTSVLPFLCCGWFWPMVFGGIGRLFQRDQTPDD